MAIFNRKLITSESILLISVFILIFSAYLFSLPHTVTLEDDGLFLMSSYFTGISHPPGYPLYSLVSWFFSIIPIGSFPFRIHAMSAFFAAGTCVLLIIFARKLNLSIHAAILVALSYAFSKAFWSQAIIAEVYTLNSFLVFILFVMALSIYKKHLPINKSEYFNFNSKDNNSVNNILYLGAFVYGLSLTTHIPLVVLSTPSLFILLYPARLNIIKLFPKLLGIFLLGMTPYLWMIWRSNTGVIINFYGAIQSVSDLSFIFSRDGYVYVDISKTSGLFDKISYLLFLLREIFNQFVWSGFIFVVIGFISQWWLWRIRICLSLFLLFLLNSFFFLFVLYFDYDYLSRSVFSVYPLIAYAVMSIWLGNGIYTVANVITKYFKVEQYKKHAVSLIGIVIVTSIIFQNISVNNRHDYNWAKEYSENLFNHLPKNTDLFVSGDIHTFVLGYMHHVEKMRTDIRVFNLQGLVFSNRLFHPTKTSENNKLKILENFVIDSKRPVCTADAINSANAHIDYWLFSCFSDEPDSSFSEKLSPELLQYFVNIANDNNQTDPWTIHHRQQLIKKMGTTFGKIRVKSDNKIIKDHENYISLVTKEFYGALGYLEGMNSYPISSKNLNEMIKVIKTVKQIPALAKKHDKASYYTIRGDVSILAGSIENGIKEYKQAIDIWPDIKNKSIDKLKTVYLKENLRDEYTKLNLRFSN